MYYTGADRSLATKFEISIGGKSLVFQFPPKITSDSRRGTWKEVELRGVEPVSIFSTSGPREFNLTAVYIQDESPDNSGPWHAAAIKENLMLARGYFVSASKAGGDSNLVVKVKLADIGGSESMTARIKNVNVKYGETYVNNFPLRSELSIDFAIWALNPKKDSFNAEDQKALQEAAPKGSENYQIPQLLPYPPEWS